MNKRIKDLVILCSMMALGVVATRAQQAITPAPPAPPATNASGAKIQFATTLYDFGRVKSGDPVKYTYVFTNTGCATLIVSNVQPQCGCTAAGEWSKQVEAGMTGSIPIQFNTASYNAAVFKQVTVTCNDKTQPVLLLQLKGVVFRPLDVTPQMAFLNLPPDAEGGSSTVTITNNTEDPLMLWDAASNNKAFTAELKTNTLGKGYHLTISAVPPLGAPGVQAQISIKTSWTNQPILNVAVYANMQPVLSVMPSIISLPPSPLEAAQTSSVSIQNNSTNPLSLTEASVNAAGVGVEIKEMQAGRMFTALATFPQGFEYPPGQQIELKMKSSNPKYPEVKVPVVQRPRVGMPPGMARPQTPPVIAPRPSPLRPVKTVTADPPPLPDVPTVR